MTIEVRVLGQTNLLQNLHRADKVLAIRLEKGLIKAGFFLLRKSQQRVPVDTGALKASGYVRKNGQGLSTEVLVGYTQSYAIYVHEILHLRHRAPTMAKFLECPAKWNVDNIKNIIKDELEGNPRPIYGTLATGSTPISRKPVKGLGSKLLHAAVRALKRVLRRLAP